MSMPKGPVDKQAAYWFAVLRSDRVSTADERAFDLWRAESPEHELAYERQLLAWDALGELEVDRDVLELRRRALRSGPRPFGLGWRGFAATAAAASLAAILATSVVATGVWDRLWSEMGGPARGTDAAILETAVGERSTATLEDGSQVELNTNTRLQAHITREQRLIRMERGQAVFHVAQERTRPFVVVAARRRIVALGTQFEVRVDHDDVAVTLITGRVAIEGPPLQVDEVAAPARPIELRPGEQFVTSGNAVGTVRPADVAKVTSWREGRLEFDNEPLSQVVREINRYSVRQVVVEDPSLAALRVSGSFRAGSVENFTKALISLHPQVVDRRDGGESIRLIWRDGVAAGRREPGY